MAVLRKNPNKEFEDLKDVAAKARRPYDKDAWLNVAFYNDEQYVEWKDDVQSIRVIPRTGKNKKTPRPVINKIMHFVNADHSFVMQNKPIPEVLPTSDSPIDVGDANVATAYLTHLWEPAQTNFIRVLSDAAHWALVANEAFLKWIYNPRLKRPDVMFVPSVDLYADPYARHFNRCRYVIHSQFMDPEQVYDLWGVRVKPNRVEKADVMRTELLRDMGQAPVMSGVTVNELWHRPSRKYPNGLYVVWTGHDILEDPTDFPYDHGHLPFTPIGAVPRPNTWHYASPVKYLRSAQMELNKYHAQRLMVREAFANPKWFVPTDLELEEDPDDSPYQVLRGHSQGGQLEPKIIQPSVFPEQSDGDWLAAEMQNIVGIHEVSQGQVPGRVEAAQAIELLREADASRLAELNDTIRAAISEGGWQWLLLAKQYVREEQIVNSYSPDGGAEVKRFKTDLVKENMRVRVTMGTGLGYTRAGRLDQVTKMVEMGLIQNPEAVSSLLEVPIPTVLSVRAQDLRRARNENLEMSREVPVAPNSWDDHAAHIQEHNTYRKTAEFLTLSKEAQQIFEFHVQKHKELEKQQLMEMAAKQLEIASAGAPPAPPAGPDQGGGQVSQESGGSAANGTPPKTEQPEPAAAPAPAPAPPPQPVPIQLDVQLVPPEREKRTLRVEEPGKPVRRIVEE